MTLFFVHYKPPSPQPMHLFSMNEESVNKYNYRVHVPKHIFLKHFDMQGETIFWLVLL